MMKKIISIIVLSLVLITSFATSVCASSYSSSITAYASSTRYEYVSGLSIYYNQSGSYPLYILSSDTYYNNSTTLTDPTEISGGFAYIVNNSNVTSSSYKNYYIAQVAILWYQDYITGNDSNISSSLKSYITNHTSGDTVCYYINKLVTNAKAYDKNNGSIVFEDKNITFTRTGNYYYSNVIDVTTNNLNSTPSVRLYNAPSSATIVSNTVTSNGTGSFQIRIPASSLTSLNEKDFEVYITGTGYNYTFYRYTNYGVKDAILGRAYSSSSSSIEASLPVSITGMGNTNVRIKTIRSNGDYISGITYNVYQGDCLNSTCYSENIVQTFTSSNSYTELNNILSSGKYTLAIKTNNTNYNLPTKTLIEVNNNTSVQTFTIDEDNYYNNKNNDDYNNRYDDEYNNNYNNNYNDYSNNSTKYKTFTIYNDLNDSRNFVKIYTTTGILIDSYKSTDRDFNIKLNEGDYYIVDTLGNIDRLYFTITDEGKLKVKINDVYVTANRIDLKENSGSNAIINDNYASSCNEDTCTNNDSYYNNDDIEVSQNVNTETTVETNFISKLINCPITGLTSTLKYVAGAIILSIGGYLTYKNVKKSKNNA